MKTGNLNRLLFLWGTLLIPLALAGQQNQVDPFESKRIKNWVNSQETGNLKEGIYALEVGAPLLELISLHSMIDSYEKGKGQKYTAFFQAPADSSFLLTMQEKNILSHYVLESKPGHLQAGKGQLGPWAIDGMISKMNIPHTNLAVRLMFGNERQFLPVVIKNNPESLSGERIRAVFRLGRNIHQGVFRVYKGKIEGMLSETTLLQGKTRIGQQIGGSTFEISVKKVNLGDYEGWITVDMVLEEMNSPRKILYRFFFYYNPNQ